MSATENTAGGYEGVEFYAEKTRANGKLAGTVLVVSREITNGQAFAAIAMPRDGRKALPVVTWTTNSYLARMGVPVTEAQAREIAPEMFKAIDAHHRSPEFQLMYQAEITKRGRTPIQNAFAPITNSVTKKFYELYGA